MSISEAEPRNEQHAEDVPQRHELAVQGVLLQRHQALLTRATCLRYVNRALCFAGLVAGAFIHVTLNGASAAAAYFGVFLINEFSRSEYDVIEKAVKDFEKLVAKQVGGKWEDLYIKSSEILSRRSWGALLEHGFWAIAALSLLIGTAVAPIFLR